MKPYEKPRLVALSLNGNEILCGSCSDNKALYLLYNDQTNIATLLDATIGNNDGTLQRSEISNLFGETEGCAQPIDLYCKFSSQITIAWS